MKTRFAFAFKSAMSLEQILVRLNDVGPWRWVEWYSDNWGDYIRTRGLSDKIVKIFVEPDHYAVEAKVEPDLSDASTQLEELRTTLFDKLLPAIAARDLTPADTYD